MVQPRSLDELKSDALPLLDRIWTSAAAVEVCLVVSARHLMTVELVVVPDSNLSARGRQLDGYPQVERSRDLLQGRERRTGSSRFEARDGGLARAHS